jgi:hypothetical protein
MMLNCDLENWLKKIGLRDKVELLDERVEDGITVQVVKVNNIDCHPFYDFWPRRQNSLDTIDGIRISIGFDRMLSVCLPKDFVFRIESKYNPDGGRYFIDTPNKKHIAGVEEFREFINRNYNYCLIGHFGKAEKNHSVFVLSVDKILVEPRRRTRP